ncbi:MAG: glycosyltransferase [Gammaproteobacteria bacterium]|nr:MAG: glycosyltransferase [Gammaproteobacteria bacterium]
MSNHGRILFISKGESSASTRYRAQNYFPRLEAAGWQTRHITAGQGLLQRLRILRAASRADVVVVLRKTFSPLFLKLLRHVSKRLVFDFDDAIFVRSNGKPSRLRSQRFKRMLQVCDQVWAGNQYLADEAGKFNNHVSVLATAIDPEKYDPGREALADSGSFEHIDIAWIGSESTSKYLKQVLPALETLAKHNPSIRLKIIADFDLETKFISTVPVQWSEDTEAAELGSSHIGIAPMIDDPWSRGKCALKILQYMASGLPVVSSAAGVNMEVVADGENGFLATSDTQWITRLQQLIDDAELRSTMGNKGKQFVTEHYSEENSYKTMLDDLNELVGS